MRYTIINRKRYAVTRESNSIVTNLCFTDRTGADHLVDAYDIQEWEDGDGTSSIDNAIKYAKYIATITDGESFAWKVR